MEHIVNLIKEVGVYGYAILFVTIFLESFPLTFYLPGDSLLFTTGFLASQGYFNVAILTFVLFLASVLGYNFSYFTGEKLRGFIIKSDDKYWFKKDHLDQTEKFYNKYGHKTVIIGRFVPIVRSFAPTLAGAVEMPFKRFMRDAVLGGFIWIYGVVFLGFFLGRIIPGVEKFLTPIILIIVTISLSPSIYEYIKSKKKIA